MWSLGRPELPVSVVVNVCREGIRNVDLSRRLEDSLEAFEAASDRYHDEASNGSVQSLSPDELTLSNVSKREMTWLYDRKFAAAGSRGRVFYDDLLLVPRNGVCPYCGDRSVAAIDHLMPKSYLPIFAVEPSQPGAYMYGLQRREAGGHKWGVEPYDPAPILRDGGVGGLAPGTLDAGKSAGVCF